MFEVWAGAEDVAELAALERPRVGEEKSSDAGPAARNGMYVSTAQAGVGRSGRLRRRRRGVENIDFFQRVDGFELGVTGWITKRWQLMRGRSGVLHTGHHLVLLGDPTRPDGTRGAVASTRVHFADVSDAEIAAYVATGEPLQVAGAFTVDGLGGPFVRAVEGDHHNVVGLSLPLLRDLLADLQVEWTDLWR